MGEESDAGIYFSIIILPASVLRKTESQEQIMQDAGLPTYNVHKSGYCTVPTTRYSLISCGLGQPQLSDPRMRR